MCQHVNYTFKTCLLVFLNYNNNPEKSMFSYPTVFLERNSVLPVQDDESNGIVQLSLTSCSVATAHDEDELCPADLQELNSLFA